MVVIAALLLSPILVMEGIDWMRGARVGLLWPLLAVAAFAAVVLHQSAA